MSLKTSNLLTTIVLVLSYLFLAPSHSLAEEKVDINKKQLPTPPPHVPNQLLVTFKEEPNINQDLTDNQSVKSETITNLPSVNALNRQLKTKFIKRLSDEGMLNKTTLIEFQESIDLIGAQKAYENLAEVESAQPNNIYHLTLAPNDPYFQPGIDPLKGFQWNLARINMPKAWDLYPSRGSTNTRVAVIDTGVAFETYGSYVKAPELKIPFVAPLRYESFRWDSNCNPIHLSTPINNTHPIDDYGHGTHVTSTIAQAINNSNHAAGIADNISIIPIRVGGECGMVTTDVIKGIQHAINNQAQVINLSIAFSETDNLVSQVISSTLNQGISVVSATGNGGSRTSSSSVLYPAAYPGVIAVGATRYDNKRAVYSTYQAGKVTLVAPGGQMGTDSNTSLLDQNKDKLFDGIVAQTIMPNNPSAFTYITKPLAKLIGSPYEGYYCFTDAGDHAVFNPDICGLYQGTSMATPHVTAVVALLKSVKPSLTPAQIITILTSTAQKSVIPNYNSTEYGAGLLDAAAALSQVIGTPTAKPGDFDADGNQDILDFLFQKSKFNTSSCPVNLYGDCLINLYDTNRLFYFMWK